MKYTCFIGTVAQYSFSPIEPTLRASLIRGHRQRAAAAVSRAGAIVGPVRCQSSDSLSIEKTSYR